MCVCVCEGERERDMVGGGREGQTYSKICMRDIVLR